MFQGTDYAYKLFEENKGRKVLVYFDPDVDGLFSGYFICKYLESRGIPYSYYINENRKHGFMLNLDKLEGYMIISVDFTIDLSIIEDMKTRDIVSINIDHHDISTNLIQWDKGIVINNQYHFEPEQKKYLSGAGVVFEVLCCWDNRFNTSDNRAIVGVTLLSDVRPIENAEAEKYLLETYSKDNSSGIFKYLIDSVLEIDYGFGVPKMDRNFIDYTFSPRLNSMFRFNEGMEAVRFVLGYGLETIDKRGLQRAYSQYLNNISSLKMFDNYCLTEIDVNDISVNEMLQFFDEIEFDYSNIIESCYNIEPSNFIGLSCSSVKDSCGKSSVAILKDNDKLIRGSFRGKYDGIEYLEVFRRNNVVAFGHMGAFGIIDMPTDDSSLAAIQQDIMQTEIGYIPTHKVMDVKNLSFFCVHKGARIAKKNNLVRDDHRTYVKYTGDNVVLKRGTPKYQEYFIDGIKVKCFDEQITVENGLILPILERGYVALYLKSVKLL